MRTKSKKDKSRILLLIFIISLIVTVYVTGAYKHLEFENVKRNLTSIQSFYETSPVLFTSYFMGVYVLITSLSIPGAIVLTLLSGAIFGVFQGALIVSISSTLGATIAFLMSRYMFREAVMKKFKKKFYRLDSKFREKGNTYLFSIRMIPISPFVVINLMMGLTSIRLWSYVWITFVAMYPGTLVYVFAGRKISQIDSPSDILTWPIILTLCLLAFLPMIFNKMLSIYRPREHYGQH